MIVVDVETSGMDPQRHSIVSIGAVDFGRPERTFYRECRVFDGALLDSRSLEINGFTPAQVTDPSRPSLEESVAAFIAWCRDAEERTLAGHNTTFDRSFLQAAADRYNLAWHFGFRVLDLHSFAWMHIARRGDQPPTRGGRTALSCNAVLTYVGLPEEPEPHHALTGATMEAEAFSRLLHGKALLPEYESFPLPAHVSSAVPVSDQQTLF